MRPASTVAAVVLALVALVHLHRVIFGWEVLVEGTPMPGWVSVVGLLVAGGLARFLWREARAK